MDDKLFKELEDMRTVHQYACDLYMSANTNDKHDYEKAEQNFKLAMKIAIKIFDSLPQSREQDEIGQLIIKLEEKIKKCQGPHFDDVVGLDEFKDLFKDNIMDVVRNPELAKKFGVKANSCILLQGPPGTGKSFVVSAAVNEFLEAKLIQTKVSTLVSAYIGETGKNIDKIFEEAKKEKCAIIFIDEIDGISRSRNLDDKGSKEAMSSLLVNMTEVDQGNYNIIFIGATNTTSVIDPAFLSRFGNNIIEIGLPKGEAISNILKKNLPNVDPNIDWDKIINKATGLNGRDLKFIANDANKKAFQKALKEGVDMPVDYDILSSTIDMALERRLKNKNYL